MIIRKGTVIVYLLGIFIFSSCQKMLDVTPEHLVEDKNFFRNVNDARAATMGNYALLRAALAHEKAYWTHGEIRGGDFAVEQRPDLMAVLQNNLLASYSAMEEWSDWRRLYAVVNHATLCIERLPEVKAQDIRYSEKQLRVDIAQARVVRAFAYFYMVRIWGDVPLITATNSENFELRSRTPKEAVLDFVISEAVGAATELPWLFAASQPEQPEDIYNGNGVNFWRSGLATKGVAYDIVAHAYAWRGDYLKAYEYCSIIQNNMGLSQYKPTSTDLLTSVSSSGTFSGRDNNVIWALSFRFDNQEYSRAGCIEDWTLRLPLVPKSYAEIYVPKDTILSVFNEEKDQRAVSYFANINDGQPIFSKINKIDNSVKGPVFPVYASAIVLFRLEELYLLTAEAAMHIGLPGQAVENLNKVRSSRGLPDFEIGDGDILETVFKERRRELMGEGWHWYDLIQFKKVPDYTRITADQVAAGAIYWPVAAGALQQNPQLTQNNYWK